MMTKDEINAGIISSIPPDLQNRAMVLVNEFVGDVSAKYGLKKGLYENKETQDQFFFSLFYSCTTIDQVAQTVGIYVSNELEVPALEVIQRALHLMRSNKNLLAEILLMDMGNKK